MNRSFNFCIVGFYGVRITKEASELTSTTLHNWLPDTVLT